MFCNFYSVIQEDIVKLQVMTLAVKLCLTNPKQTKLLCQYVLQLARYDQNYDLRDRARFLRHIIFPGDAGNGGPTRLSKHAKKLFLAPKPAPIPESQFKGNFTNQKIFSMASKASLTLGLTL